MKLIVEKSAKNRIALHQPNRGNPNAKEVMHLYYKLNQHHKGIRFDIDPSLPLQYENNKLVLYSF